MAKRPKLMTQAEREALRPGPENYSWIQYEPHDPPPPDTYSVLTRDGIDTYATLSTNGTWWSGKYGALDVDLFREQSGTSHPGYPARA